MSAGREVHCAGHWWRLNGPDRLAEIIRGVRFHDDEPAHDTEDQVAA